MPGVWLEREVTNQPILREGEVWVLHTFVTRNTYDEIVITHMLISIVRDGYEILMDIEGEKSDRVVVKTWKQVKNLLRTMAHSYGII